MNEKKILIEKVNAPEIFNTIKYRMEDAGIFVTSPEVVADSLQFKFVVGNKIGVVRIEEVADYGVTLDLTHVGDTELENILRRMISDSIGRDTEQDDRSITASYEFNIKDRVLGLDEAGTGDYFGPLVISGIIIDQKNASELANITDKDPRSLDSNTLKKIADQITSKYHTVTVILPPELYNEMFIRHKEMNLILLKAHTRAVQTAQKKHDISVAIIDRFGEEDLSTNILGETDIKIIHSFNANKHPAVAAAAFLARYIYFREVETLAQEYNMKFVRGTGDEVVSVARSFIKSYGLENLFKVAKVNFLLTGLLL